MAGIDTHVGTVQDALKTAIDAQSPGVTVSIGYPSGGPKSEGIWISGEPRVTVVSDLSCYSQRDEHIEQDVFVYTQGTGGVYTTKRDRCLVLVGEVEDALAADRTLGSACSVAYVSGFELSESVAGTDRGVGATVHIVIEATVT